MGKEIDAVLLLNVNESVGQQKERKESYAEDTENTECREREGLDGE
jgi:hypothetical protein